ncbi:hypothetical protein E2C01_099435 [Portunus trituberculatus]|uniref:Uncharacterized protein n=1 Tax=Portunus trituberculatus TaxID=210409 RepID=A0A5B7K3T8_PORTR|nr:hypothetical protein [Portunus trituberculatus]
MLLAGPWEAMRDVEGAERQKHKPILVKTRYHTAQNVRLPLTSSMSMMTTLGGCRDAETPARKTLAASQAEKHETTPLMLLNLAEMSQLPNATLQFLHAICIHAPTHLIT